MCSCQTTPDWGGDGGSFRGNHQFPQQRWCDGGRETWTTLHRCLFWDAVDATLEGSSIFSRTREPVAPHPHITWAPTHQPLNPTLISIHNHPYTKLPVPSLWPSPPSLPSANLPTHLQGLMCLFWNIINDCEIKIKSNLYFLLPQISDTTAVTFTFQSIHIQSMPKNKEQLSTTTSPLLFDLSV